MYLNKLTPGHEELIRHKANKLQAKADRITAFRNKYAPILGGAIALTKPNWVTTGVTAHMWYGDRRDGKHAKNAQNEMAKITGKIEPLSDGHIKDPQADKKHFWSQLGGLFVRSIIQKDPNTTLVTAGVGVVTYLRDKKMAEMRDFVTKNKLDKPVPGHEDVERLTISVAAIDANRAKTAGQAISETVLGSPLSNNETVKKYALGGLAASTILGVVGYREYRQRVQDTYLARETYFASLCPDEIEYSPSQLPAPVAEQLSA